MFFVSTPPTHSPVTILIFTLSYIALAVGRVPGSTLDRAGIALVGAAAMLAAGSLSLHAAARSVDYETILLLFGMMIVVEHLRASGFFALATERIARRRPGPYVLLAATIFLSGVLSAFLVNDVVCLALTPLVIDLCKRLKRPPIPFLIGVATASNVGSTATITGNPQNMIIGSLSAIPYARFSARLAPIALVGLAINYVMVLIVYRRSLASELLETGEDPVVEAIEFDASAHGGRRLLVLSVVVAAATIALFFAGMNTALAAFLGAATILTIGRIRPERIYHAIDWPLLIMFAGLFVVVRSFEINVVKPWGLDSWTPLRKSPVLLLSGLSVLFSNLVSNVPAVLLFKPVIEALPNKEPSWLALAMSSTLAGNLTVLGSVANLIVVENARKLGIRVGFLEYLKVGVPLTILTVAAGILWLTATRY
jgi:Na+/H+ antiporter NhaD/arsenite permease-like protein